MEKVFWLPLLLRCHRRRGKDFPSCLYFPNSLGPGLNPNERLLKVKVDENPSAALVYSMGWSRTPKEVMYCDGACIAGVIVSGDMLQVRTGVYRVEEARLVGPIVLVAKPGDWLQRCRSELEQRYGVPVLALEKDGDYGLAEDVERLLEEYAQSTH
jgi:hypothetical protein